jgi:plastocyanin
VWIGVLVATSGLAPGQAPAPPGTGRIEGAVTLSQSLSVRKPRIRVYGEYGPGALPPPRTAVNELANVVIYLDSAVDLGPADAAAPPPSDTAPLVIEQRDETFRPHVRPVLRGATVAFPNQDPVFHNVFSLSSARSFDLGRYPKGASKSVRFDRAGVVQVFCHIHSDMSAVVLVLDNPFFAVPAGGRYVLEGVPAGEYRLVAWHERINPVARHVRVTAGGVTSMNFDIPLPPDDAEPRR